MSVKLLIHGMNVKKSVLLVKSLNRYRICLNDRLYVNGTYEIYAFVYLNTS